MRTPILALIVLLAGLTARAEAGVVAAALQPAPPQRGLTNQTQGSISGRITDLQDGPVPGTRVTATSGSGQIVTVVTNSSGHYTIGTLTAGHYSIAARMVGFITVTRDNVEVTNGETSSVDLRLAVGSPDEPICNGVAADTGPGLADAVHRAEEIVYARIETAIEKGYRPSGNDIIRLVLLLNLAISVALGFAFYWMPIP